MADNNLFAVKLVTPERVLVTGSATEVMLRTGEGDITFLAGHTPLVGTVEPGVVRVVRGRGRRRGGWPSTAASSRSSSTCPEDEDGPATSGTRVTLLVGVAELAEEIDVERARTALDGGRGAGGRAGWDRGRGSGAGTTAARPRSPTPSWSRPRRSSCGPRCGSRPPMPPPGPPRVPVPPPAEAPIAHRRRRDRSGPGHGVRPALSHRQPGCGSVGVLVQRVPESAVDGGAGLWERSAHRPSGHDRSTAGAGGPDPPPQLRGRILCSPHRSGAPAPSP